MTDVNKVRDELNMAREERKSWMTEHNNAVTKSLKTGAESEEVADELISSLLSEGTLTLEEWDRKRQRQQTLHDAVEEEDGSNRHVGRSTTTLIDMLGIIMAGGQGSRLRPITDVRPKPMVEVLGRLLSIL